MNDTAEKSIKHDVIHKKEVHNVLQVTTLQEEDQATATCRQRA